MIGAFVEAVASSRTRLRRARNLRAALKTRSHFDLVPASALIQTPGLT